MLQTRPEIHCDRADLNLDFGIDHTVRKVYRNGYEHVIALVSALFRVFYIVFDG